MKKRLLSILLTVCMVLTLLPSVSLTAEAASSVWNGSCDSSLTETARDGSSGTGYYLINSAEKLAQVAYLSNNGNNFTGKTVLLTDDMLRKSHPGPWKQPGTVSIPESSQDVQAETLSRRVRRQEQKLRRFCKDL